MLSVWDDGEWAENASLSLVLRCMIGDFPFGLIDTEGWAG